MAPVLVIVGPPGAGKTTVGRLVADRLGTSFRDTDLDVAERAGCSVADLFVDQGEEAFRNLEKEAVAAGLAEQGGVLALGGGAVLDASTRELLHGQRVVFLDVAVKDAASRIGFNRDRPLLLGNPRAQWMRLMEKRRGFYDEVAVATVSTDGRTPDDIAEEVVSIVKGADTGADR